MIITVATLHHRYHHLDGETVTVHADRDDAMQNMAGVALDDWTNGDIDCRGITCTVTGCGGRTAKTNGHDGLTRDEILRLYFAHTPEESYVVNDHQIVIDLSTHFAGQISELREALTKVEEAAKTGGKDAEIAAGRRAAEAASALLAQMLNDTADSQVSA